MATAKTRYLQKIYEEKHGCIGKVASRYLEAGYSIELMHSTRYGCVHILARKSNMVLAIDVVDKQGTVTIDMVKLLLDKSKLLRARPILILYSDGPKIDDEVHKFCVEHGIKIRRLR